MDGAFFISYLDGVPDVETERFQPFPFHLDFRGFDIFAAEITVFTLNSKRVLHHKLHKYMGGLLSGILQNLACYSVRLEGICTYQSEGGHTYADEY